MIKKTITFQDLDGNSITEDFYFNLSKADLIEMQASEKGGFAEVLKKIVAEEDNVLIMKYFKELLAKSYGKRSEDGRRFIKSPELSEEFFQTDAYSELMMELFSDAAYAAEFFSGLMPAGIGEELEKQMKSEQPTRRQPSDYQKPKVSLKDLNK